MTQTTEPRGLVASVQLSASVESLTEAMREQRDRLDRLTRAVRPVYITGIPMTLSGGDGTLNVPNMLGPATGRYWDVHRITVSGFTAGTVTVYDSSTAGDTLLIIASAGSQFLGKAQMLLAPQRTLVFSASGITGTVAVSMAMTEIEARWIGDYLL